MIPPRILEAFRAVPDEVVEVCRPHAWPEVTTPPGEGMRAIRDILVHMLGTEAYWVDHVIRGNPRTRFRPESFEGLDAVLARWRPQRDATVALVEALPADDRRSERPLPWDHTRTVSVEEILWHVVAHEQYHRGQIFTRLALLGRRDLPDYDLIR